MGYLRSVDRCRDPGIELVQRSDEFGDVGVLGLILATASGRRGITVYLLNGGPLEYAQKMAAHESARTTKLYDRRNGQVTLGQVERIVCKKQPLQWKIFSPWTCFQMSAIRTSSKTCWRNCMTIYAAASVVFGS